MQNDIRIIQQKIESTQPLQGQLSRIENMLIELKEN